MRPLARIPCLWAMMFSAACSAVICCIGRFGPGRAVRNQAVAMLPPSGHKSLSELQDEMYRPSTNKETH